MAQYFYIAFGNTNNIVKCDINFNIVATITAPVWAIGNWRNLLYDPYKKRLVGRNNNKVLMLDPVTDLEISPSGFTTGYGAGAPFDVGPNKYYLANGNDLFIMDPVAGTYTSQNLSSQFNFLISNFAYFPDQDYYYVATNAQRGALINSSFINILGLHVNDYDDLIYHSSNRAVYGFDGNGDSLIYVPSTGTPPFFLNTFKPISGNTSQDGLVSGDAPRYLFIVTTSPSQTFRIFDKGTNQFIPYTSSLMPALRPVRGVYSTDNDRMIFVKNEVGKIIRFNANTLTFETLSTSLDTANILFIVPVPISDPPLIVCNDPNAINYGQSGSCVYPAPPPPAGSICNDPNAINYGQNGVCKYPVQIVPAPTCDIKKVLLNRFLDNSGCVLSERFIKLASMFASGDKGYENEKYILIILAAKIEILYNYNPLEPYNCIDCKTVNMLMQQLKVHLPMEVDLNQLEKLKPVDTGGIVLGTGGAPGKIPLDSVQVSILEELNGIEDFSTYKHNGLIYGSLDLIAGEPNYGKAANFNNSSQSQQIGFGHIQPMASGKLRVRGFVKFNSTANQFVMGWGDPSDTQYGNWGWLIYLESQKLVFLWYGAVVSSSILISTTTIQPNVWYEFEVRFYTTNTIVNNYVLYINRVKEAENSYSSFQDIRRLDSYKMVLGTIPGLINGGTALYYGNADYAIDKLLINAGNDSFPYLVGGLFPATYTAEAGQDSFEGTPILFAKFDEKI